MCLCTRHWGSIDSFDNLNIACFPFLMAFAYQMLGSIDSFDNFDNMDIACFPFFTVIIFAYKTLWGLIDSFDNFDNMDIAHFPFFNDSCIQDRGSIA